MRIRTSRHIAVALLAAAIALGVASPATAQDAVTQAAPAQTTPGDPPPAGHPDVDSEAEHVARTELPVSRRAPMPSSDAELRADYDESESHTGQGRATCGFVGLSGAALADSVAAADPSCVSGLFALTGQDARRTLSEANMAAVAERLRTVAAAYPGDDSTGAGRLVTFLRAGYHVAWHETAIGGYGDGLTDSVRSTLDTFFAAERAFDVSEGNGRVLSEAVLLADGAGLGARYLPVVKRLLNGYNSAYDRHPGMVDAVNSVYTLLFRGHTHPEFVAAVDKDRGVLTALRGFAVRHKGLLSGSKRFLPANAGRELARFLQHDSLRPAVRPMVRQLLAQSSRRGGTAALWVGLAEMADSYDKANCAAYGTCDLRATLSADVLPINYTCASTLRIRAQEMTASQLSQTCASLLNQDAYFHSVARDPGPVSGDRNTSLEVVVYNSSTDYRTYAGAHWGIDTNNGGMYLEGDPSASGNQARFIAYEAEWLRPTFAIWNLNHEYTHYLDGRFTMHGDFTSNMRTPTVWWIEGFAEYISYHYRGVTYSSAITEAGRRTYALSTLFDTTYSHDSTRVYPWGYLAVRYMLQSHRGDLDTVLSYYRRGDWNGARSFLLNTIGTRYNSDWYSWLSRCASGQCDGGSGGNQPPTADFTTTITGRTAAFTDRSTDADGTITARRWDFGDGTTSTTTSPTRTYTADGIYTVTLTVTDNNGATATTSRSVTIGSSSLPECTGSDTRALGKDCQRSNRSASNSYYDHMYLLLPAGTTQLQITASGGSGNCDLYYNAGTWATSDNATHRSTSPANQESVTVANPPSGYVYISLKGSTACTGVAVSTSF
ncbi:collagenase [Actinokineospora fastidiosa]|uniref:microbial collagenase n=1 Tax=Actinokineospora fastidiosa TaxID=1816 RepID=A0A918LIU8_9PSEU|nr:collagenase [Actinokineospora fastidiosa]GGS53999.1 protease [Actinokineospora fastidiosa]